MRGGSFLLLAAATVACASSNGASKGSAGATGSGGSGNAGGSAGSSSSGGSSGGSSGSGGSAGSGGGTAVSGASVLEHHNSPSRAGLYVASNLTRAAAATLHVDTTFTATYTGPTYAQPLFVDGGGTGADMLFVATEQDQVLAFDASTGQQLWQKSLGTPMQLAQMPCGNINPLGITGTPIIDLPSRTLFVDAMTSQAGAPHHQVFALSIDDGSIRTGWPVDADASFQSGTTTFDSSVQGERGALALLGGNLYVPYGGFYGDCGNYHGWVVSIPIANPSQLKAWATTARGAAIWAPAGLSGDGTSIYGVTGNGFATTWGQSEMVGRFGGASLFSGQTADYWVPTNWQALDNADVDMSGTSAIPFDLPGATPSALLAAFGKDGVAYLVNRQNMGGISAPVASFPASTSAIINAAAEYRTPSATYLATWGRNSTGVCSGISTTLVTLKVTAGSPPGLDLAWCGDAGGGKGSPMVTTTDGTSESIVWSVGAEGDNRLHGFNGDTGAVIFGGGGTGDAMGATRRFITPIVAKGRIFVAADSQLYAFKTN